MRCRKGHPLFRNRGLDKEATQGHGCYCKISLAGRQGSGCVLRVTLHQVDAAVIASSVATLVRPGGKLMHRAASLRVLPFPARCPLLCVPSDCARPRHVPFSVSTPSPPHLARSRSSVLLSLGNIGACSGRGRPAVTVRPRQRSRCTARLRRSGHN